MDTKTAYKQAYRHLRIKQNMDEQGWYWVAGWNTTCPVVDLPTFDLFTPGVLHLDPIAVGNALKSIETQYTRDYYEDRFINRHYDTIGWKRYEQIMANIDPSYSPIRF